MSCCPQNAGTLSPRHRMKVRYGGGRPVRIKGPGTGTEYQFSGSEPLQLVHPRDAVAIVRSPLFRIEGVVEVEAGHVAFVRKGPTGNA